MMSNPGKLCTWSSEPFRTPAVAIIFSLMLLGGAVISHAWAQSPVTVTLGSQSAGTPIPAGFLGLSFGMKTLLPDKDGGHFFSATNVPLVTLLRNIGIKHLRLGGTTVESPPSTPIPDPTDIDNLFAFVEAARIEKVIYSLRLLETAPYLHYAATNAALAKYIWAHYRSRLDLFAIGNEPDRRNVYDQDVSITNFATYLGKWREFAAAITNAVPAAKFAGPDAGSGNVYWTTQFADATKGQGSVQLITEHFYVGGAGRGKTAEQGLEAILSTNWIAANERLYERMALPVIAAGLPYRFTEASDHYSGGIPHASDTFAAALWALDFLHWWAAHGTSGVNFHNTQWVVNDVITLDLNRQLVANPKAYGLKAFALGGQGAEVPVTMNNSDGLNATAYAVWDGSQFYVTLINKEHGFGARDAQVTIDARDSGLASAAAIFLSAPQGDVATKGGVTIGGAAITNNALWAGNWSELPSATNGHYAVTVKFSSAAVVRLRTVPQPAPPRESR